MAWLSTLTLLGLLVYSSVSRAVLFKPQNEFQSISTKNSSFAVDLTPLFNNRAFGITLNESNFDNYGSAYPAQHMPPSSFSYNGFNYEFPTYNASGFDNVVTLGQKIQLPRSKYFSVQMLAASESGMASGSIKATYADGSTSSSPLLVPAWWNWPILSGGDLVFPYLLTNSSIDYNRTNIFQTVNWLDSSKELVSLTLPNSTSGSADSPGGDPVDTRLHIFALSVWPVHVTPAKSPRLGIQYARSTQKWIEGTNQTQIIEVSVNNIGSAFVLKNHTVRLRVESPGVETISEGVVKRLGPGDQAIVEIGVRNRKGIEAGSTGPATIVISGNEMISSNYTFNATYGIQLYDATYESIYSHESPDWYNNAKYGIFIHWGPYSVPGWGNSGDREEYAEWYWWYLNQGPHTTVDTYDYHLKTYGPNVVYDDFIQNFTADAWDPKEWVDLFADAGANYFVPTSKHHDGYALFDLPSNVTERTSVAMYPHRNLLEELFDAAKNYQPQLHRAVYYSLPEWFNPDYQKYGFSTWPGGNATNPFTNQTLEYTGYVPLADYLTDKMLPEMNALAEMGTELMWCDIGGPNLTTEFASSWYNKAAKTNRQVLINSRCGLPGDYDTPEYASYDAVQVRKWETSLGMDPFSYGFNRATPAASYMNASTIVTSLIDVVSKNGNFLLDIGPMANGTIVDIEQKNLRQAGKWIRSHADAVFNTTYWFVTPEEGDNIRFTQSQDAFYVHSLARPNGSLILNSPIPWVDGDQVTVVGGGKGGAVIPSKRLGNGSVILTVDEDIVNADQYAWVFKITY